MNKLALFGAALLGAAAVAVSQIEECAIYNLKIDDKKIKIEISEKGYLQILKIDNDVDIKVIKKLLKISTETYYSNDPLLGDNFDNEVYVMAYIRSNVCCKLEEA